MGNKWSNGIDRARESDCHVAALLTSALLTNARVSTSLQAPALAEASQAVDLYRCVLAALVRIENVEDAESVDPASESATMQQLDVSMIGTRYRYRDYLYDKLDDALNYARKEREREREATTPAAT